ncbi:cysteine peptidase family C39 domain-containing protein [Massilia sp. H-1]|nr:cysteine peptidase family C39 domain-containing protein [Massilia sp. H-1]
MLANYHGYHSDLADLRRRFSISLKGATLAQIARHASAMQLSTRPLRLNLDELAQLNLPCILHWRLNHFVVLKKVQRNRRGEIILQIIDPAIGERKVSMAETSSEFTGVALEVSPSPAFRQSETRERISVRDLTGKVAGLRPALTQVLLLAAALEIFAVASPLLVNLSSMK